jgi:hypothetical protein
MDLLSYRLFKLKKGLSTELDRGSYQDFGTPKISGRVVGGAYQGLECLPKARKMCLPGAT